MYVILFGIHLNPFFSMTEFSCFINNITIIIKFYQRKIIVFASRPYQSNYMLQPFSTSIMDISSFTINAISSIKQTHIYYN